MGTPLKQQPPHESVSKYDQKLARIIIGAETLKQASNSQEPQKERAGGDSPARAGCQDNPTPAAKSANKEDNALWRYDHTKRRRRLAWLQFHETRSCLQYR